MTTALLDCPKNILKRDYDEKWYSIPPGMEDEFTYALEQTALTEWGTDEYWEAVNYFEQNFCEYKK